MISIIIPVYKVEGYICRCVNSILSQTFRDFEILTVDDGSPDNSAEFCDEYALLNSNYISVHKTNSGVSGTRNIGTKLSSGEYISFVDSDDWIDYKFLEMLYGRIISEGTEIAICEAIVVNDDSIRDSSQEVTSVKRTRREAIEYYARMDLQYKSNAFRSPWGKLINRAIVLKHLFPVDRSYAEDAACVYRWIWEADSISCIDNQLYFYYQNPNSVCHSEAKINILGGLETDEEWIEFFKKNSFTKLYQSGLRMYLNDCVWMYQALLLSSEPQNARLISEKMRSFAWKNRKEVSYSFDEIYRICSIAWPNVVRIFEIPQRVMSRLKR